MADDLDVKEEEKNLTKRQQASMRDTADDEDFARQKRKQKGWNLKSAQNKEMYDLMTTDPNTAERKNAMRKDEYLIKTTGDKGTKKKVSSTGKISLQKKTKKKTTKKVSVKK